MAKINIHTERANKAFAKLSRPQKRVAIARDILKALDTNAIKAMSGEYLEIDNFNPEPNSFTPVETPLDGSFREFLPKAQSCKVCAKGAIFVCTVARRNKISNDEAGNINFVSSNNLSNKLGNIFSPKQLTMIENEFECSAINGSYQPVMNLYKFSDVNRMKIIMKNIIKNKGTFIPVTRV